MFLSEEALNKILVVDVQNTTILITLKDQEKPQEIYYDSKEIAINKSERLIRRLKPEKGITL